MSSLRLHAGAGAGTGRFPAVARVWALTLLLSITALVIYMVALHGIRIPVPPVVIPWPIIAVAFAVAELKVVEVHFRRETHSFSLSEFPAVIGLFFLSPVDYLLALIVGSAAVLVVAERTSCGPA